MLGGRNGTWVNTYGREGARTFAARRQVERERRERDDARRRARRAVLRRWLRSVRSRLTRRG